MKEQRDAECLVTLVAAGTVPVALDAVESQLREKERTMRIEYTSDLQDRLRKALDALRNIVRAELPEADDLDNPDAVTISVSHMDHEDYRRRIREAKQLLSESE